MSRALVLAAWAIALALAVGCSAAQRGMPDDGPRSAAALIAALQPPKVQTLQGTARLDAFVAGERRAVTLLVLAKRPAGLQFQALAPTLDMLALLSSDGQRFTSYERGGEQCLTGLACPRNLARILPLPLPAAELVAALLGDLAPLAAAADQQTLAWDEARQLYRLELGPKTGLNQHFYVEPKTLRPAGAVWYQGERRLTSLQYDGALVAGGLRQRLKIKATQPEVEMTVELREIQADAPLGDEAFAVTCPDGMRQVELACEPPAGP